MTQNKIIVAALIKDEAKKFLPSALKAWGDFSDLMVVVDDNSEDESAQLCKDAGAVVVKSKQKKSMWGSESAPRRQLWKEASAAASDGDWIFVLDADMVPAKNPFELIDTHNDAIAFPLFDIWEVYSDNLHLYREDSFWRGHLHPRIWAVKFDSEKDKASKFNKAQMHTGHLPENWNIERPVFTPIDYSLLHYAYSSNVLRVHKYQQYASVRADLSDFQRKHAQSILDPSPFLKTLPFKPQYTLQCEFLSGL